MVSWTVLCLLCQEASISWLGCRRLVEFLDLFWCAFGVCGLCFYFSHRGETLIYHCFSHTFSDLLVRNCVVSTPVFHFMLWEFALWLSSVSPFYELFVFASLGSLERRRSNHCRMIALRGRWGVQNWPSLCDCSTHVVWFAWVILLIYPTKPCYYAEPFSPRQ